jgi:hypothetical protein
MGSSGMVFSRSFPSPHLGGTAGNDATADRCEIPGKLQIIPFSRQAVKLMARKALSPPIRIRAEKRSEFSRKTVLSPYFSGCCELLEDFSPINLEFP